ncbi:MAG: WD40/YVTN/BNR-like repeat-containing protein [Candidatus Kapaibacterium sp.]
MTFVGDSIVIGVGYDGGTVRSIDKGTTWDYVQTDDTCSFRAAWTSKDGSVFVGGENGSVQRSDDSGRTWFRLSKPRPLWPVRSIAFVDRLRGAAVLGDPGMLLYQTTDGGGTWTEPLFREIADHRVPAYLESLMVTDDGNIIGYGQRGIIVSWTPETSSTPADELCSTCLPRFSVSPVPADDFLVIRSLSYDSASESGPLTVHVFDALGALVMQQSIDHLYDTQLDLRCLSSGAYHLMVRDVNMQTFRTTFIVAR